MLPSAEAAKLYQTNYVRNSRVIGLLWAIFTILFGIVNVTIFSQPYWIGDGVDTPQAGYFGLFHYCIGDGISRELACQGSFTEFAAIPSSAFKAASFFIGMSMMLVVTCIGCFSLFFLLSTSTVYKICGWMQAASGKCISLALELGAGAGGDTGDGAWGIIHCRCLNKRIGESRVMQNKTTLNCHIAHPHTDKILTDQSSRGVGELFSCFG